MEVLKDKKYSTAKDGNKSKQKHKNPRQFLISAEPAKAVTEESIFRGKEGVLFTFALECAKVKALAAWAWKTLMFYWNENIKRKSNCYGFLF